MDTPDQLNLLITSYKSKKEAFEIAFTKYCTPGQEAITFSEMCDLKDELEDFRRLIEAFYKVYGG